MKRWNCRAGLWPAYLGLFVLIAASLFALEIARPTSDYVNDFASLLNESDRKRLNDRLQQFEERTSNQIVVTIFPSLEDESLEDFSNRLFETWRIGKKSHDNGVLLAVFVKERRVRIEVGYGLEAVLTDALSSRIIRNELAPEFQAGRHAAGIERAIVAIEKAIAGEYQPSTQPEGPRFISYLPILIFFLLVIFSLLRSRRDKKRFRGRRRRDVYDDWWMIPPGRWGGGGFGGGGGGGGFSGGGGRSGGGGASGGW